MQLSGLVAMRRRRSSRLWPVPEVEKFVVTLAVNRAGLIVRTGLAAAADAPAVALPTPTGRNVVGTDVVQVVDRARGGRRLMITRWYPAVPSARKSHGPRT